MRGLQERLQPQQSDSPCTPRSFHLAPQMAEDANAWNVCVRFGGTGSKRSHVLTGGGVGFDSGNGVVRGRGRVVPHALELCKRAVDILNNLVWVSDRAERTSAPERQCCHTRRRDAEHPECKEEGMCNVCVSE